MQLEIGNESYLSQQRCLDHLLIWFYLECSQWQAQTYPIVVKFQVANSITFRDMNYYPVTDGRTESDAYEPTICTGGLKKVQKIKDHLEFEL